MPKAAVKIDIELVVHGEPLHRAPFPHSRVSFDVTVHLRREYKEAAIDPATVSLRFFLKSDYTGSVVTNCTEAARGLRARHRCEPSACLVLRNQLRHVDICETVAIG